MTQVGQVFDSTWKEAESDLRVETYSSDELARSLAPLSGCTGGRAAVVVVLVVLVVFASQRDVGSGVPGCLECEI